MSNIELIKIEKNIIPQKKKQKMKGFCQCCGFSKASVIWGNISRCGYNWLIKGCIVRAKPRWVELGFSPFTSLCIFFIQRDKDELRSSPFITFSVSSI